MTYVHRLRSRLSLVCAAAPRQMLMRMAMGYPIAWTNAQRIFVKPLQVYAVAVSAKSIQMAMDNPIV